MIKIRKSFRSTYILILLLIIITILIKTTLSFSMTTKAVIMSFMIITVISARILTVVMNMIIL